MASAVAAARAARAALLELDARRQVLEAELATATPLALPGEALVDAEGFPRADVDLFAVRGARNRAAMLRNDLKALGRDIDEALAAMHACGPAAIAAAVAEARLEAANAPAAPGANAPAQLPLAQVPPPPPLRAFALVDGVAPDSPAATAGLMREDHLVAVGGSRSISEVAEAVRSSEGRPLQLCVLRTPLGGGAAQELSLTLVPLRWSGQGLLGCHIVPV